MEVNMDINVPYMLSVGNVPAILGKIQNAGVPDAFGHDFLRDLGFTSSNDRGIIKVLKYLGMLDASGKPQAAYREFTNHTKSKSVLADRLRIAFDDLYRADKNAHNKSVEELKGWFKSKTGTGEAVAQKIATTFKTFANQADFSKSATDVKPLESELQPAVNPIPGSIPPQRPHASEKLDLGLVYRIEIHLPDTQNLETYRAIFKAIREELTG
jgi:hypothetical protein